MSVPDWRIPASLQPNARNYAFDLDRVLDAMVAVSARIPEDAFTAETLGTERAGNGVVIDDKGTVLTIGYLITEAEEVWLRANDGRLFPGTVLGYDQETGFGLIQALARLDLPYLRFGDSDRVQTGDMLLVAGAGGRERSLSATVVARQEFAGYWEYVLDNAILTSPAHPNWGGTAAVDEAGELVGIGSLHLEENRDANKEGHINMIVPINLLKPIIDDLKKFGRRNAPARPWLGIYATEMGDHIVVVGRSQRGPARRADLKNGDILLAVGGHPVRSLANFYRRLQSQGVAGVEIPLTIQRDGKTFEVRVKSGDRTHLFKAPKLH
jgi:S1-C subfamily serine protease